MAWTLVDWPPSRQEFFRAHSAPRPLFQGDIFERVPFIKAKAGDHFESDPKIECERRVVAILGYPCEMYAQGSLVKVQTIAVVREAEKLGVPADWRGAFGVCPVPDLFGDRKLWAIDFRTMAPADRMYLTPNNRVASLSEFGWAYLRQRLAVYHTRVANHLDDLQAAGRATWEEMELWEQWNALGRPPERFQAWLDTFDPGIGFSHRTALERGMGRLVSSAMLAAKEGLG